MNQVEGNSYSEVEVDGKLRETVWRSGVSLQICVMLHSGGIFECTLPGDITDADHGQILDALKRNIRSHP